MKPDKSVLSNEKPSQQPDDSTSNKKLDELLKTPGVEGYAYTDHLVIYVSDPSLRRHITSQFQEFVEIQVTGPIQKL